MDVVGVTGGDSGRDQMKKKFRRNKHNSPASFTPPTTGEAAETGSSAKDAAVGIKSFVTHNYRGTSTTAVVKSSGAEKATTAETTGTTISATKNTKSHRNDSDWEDVEMAKLISSDSINTSELEAELERQRKREKKKVKKSRRHRKLKKSKRSKHNRAYSSLESLSDLEINVFDNRRNFTPPLVNQTNDATLMDGPTPTASKRTLADKIGLKTLTAASTTTTCATNASPAAATTTAVRPTITIIDNYGNEEDACNTTTITTEAAVRTNTVDMTSGSKKNKNQDNDDINASLGKTPPLPNKNSIFENVRDTTTTNTPPTNDDSKPALIKNTVGLQVKVSNSNARNNHSRNSSRHSPRTPNHKTLQHQHLTPDRSYYQQTTTPPQKRRKHEFATHSRSAREITDYERYNRDTYDSNYRKSKSPCEMSRRQSPDLSMASVYQRGSNAMQRRNWNFNKNNTSALSVNNISPVCEASSKSYYDSREGSAGGSPAYSKINRTKRSQSREQSTSPRKRYNHGSRTHGSNRSHRRYDNSSSQSSSRSRSRSRTSRSRSHTISRSSSISNTGDVPDLKRKRLEYSKKIGDTSLFAELVKDKYKREKALQEIIERHGENSSSNSAVLINDNSPLSETPTNSNNNEKTSKLVDNNEASRELQKNANGSLPTKIEDMNPIESNNDDKMNSPITELPENNSNNLSTTAQTNDTSKLSIDETDKIINNQKERSADDEIIRNAANANKKTYINSSPYTPTSTPSAVALDGTTTCSTTTSTAFSTTSTATTTAVRPMTTKKVSLTSLPIPPVLADLVGDSGGNYSPTSDDAPLTFKRSAFDTFRRGKRTQKSQFNHDLKSSSSLPTLMATQSSSAKSSLSPSRSKKSLTNVTTTTNHLMGGKLKLGSKSLLNLPMPPTLVEGSESLSGDELIITPEDFDAPNYSAVVRSGNSGSGRSLAMNKLTANFFERDLFEGFMADNNSTNSSSSGSSELTRLKRPTILSRVNSRSNVRDWGERCVDVFEMIAQIGEGTYGQVRQKKSHAHQRTVLSGKLSSWFAIFLV